MTVTDSVAYLRIKMDLLQVYGQVSLTFRYGRDDEEVMGLKFSSEVVMAMSQLYPVFLLPDKVETVTPLQVYKYVSNIVRLLC